MLSAFNFIKFYLLIFFLDTHSDFPDGEQIDSESLHFSTDENHGR
jgi:hypothetical protein